MDTHGLGRQQGQGHNWRVVFTSSSLIKMRERSPRRVRGPLALAGCTGGDRTTSLTHAARESEGLGPGRSVGPKPGVESVNGPTADHSVPADSHAVAVFSVPGRQPSGWLRVAALVTQSEADRSSWHPPGAAAACAFSGWHFALVSRCPGHLIPSDPSGSLPVLGDLSGLHHWHHEIICSLSQSLLSINLSC